MASVMLARGSRAPAGRGFRRRGHAAVATVVLALVMSLFAQSAPAAADPPLVGGGGNSSKTGLTPPPLFPADVVQTAVEVPGRPDDPGGQRLTLSRVTRKPHVKLLRDGSIDPDHPIRKWTIEFLVRHDGVDGAGLCAYMVSELPDGRLANAVAVSCDGGGYTEIPDMSRRLVDLAAAQFRSAPPSDDELQQRMREAITAYWEQLAAEFGPTLSDVGIVSAVLAGVGSGVVGSIMTGAAAVACVSMLPTVLSFEVATDAFLVQAALSNGDRVTGNGAAAIASKVGSISAFLVGMAACAAVQALSTASETMKRIASFVQLAAGAIMAGGIASNLEVFDWIYEVKNWQPTP